MQLILTTNRDICQPSDQKKTAASFMLLTWLHTECTPRARTPFVPRNMGTAGYDTRRPAAKKNMYILATAKNLGTGKRRVDVTYNAECMYIVCCICNWLGSGRCFRNKRTVMTCYNSLHGGKAFP